jgi:nucleoside 2-deoxyribosyltransferase
VKHASWWRNANDMIIYCAGPLFTSAEREWNRGWLALRAEGFVVRLPQEDAAALIAGSKYDPAALFKLACSSVSSSEAVLAVLDGVDVDSGTAFECGVAWAKGIPIVGLRTDLRGGGDGNANVNLMLSESCRTIVQINALTEPNIEDIAQEIVSALKSIVTEDRNDRV